MKFETEVGTDIAMIGIWDSDVQSGEIPSTRLMEELSKDGQRGKLLRVETGADGRYSICVVSTLEELRAFRLGAYAKIKHDFFLSTQSGLFIAGGLENYRNGTPKITSKDDQFRLKPGNFRIHAYAYNEDEDQISSQVEADIGEADLRHYEDRKSGCGFAMGTGLVGVALGLFWSWWVLLPAVLLASGILLYYRRLTVSDGLIQRVEGAFRAYEKAHPTLIFYFESVPEIGVSRGFFHLDELWDKPS